MIQRIRPDTRWPLHGTAASRAIEQAALAATPPHALMQRAGEAVARLALALHPHARCIWIACGPGNNGGDGLVAALALAARDAAARGQRIAVSWQGDPARLPADAAWAWQGAQAAGLDWVDAPPEATDLAIDALLGLGGHARAPAEGSRLREWMGWLRATPCPVLCVDLPSGLDADHGHQAPLSDGEAAPGPRHTLSLLTLKPGLFTAQGRDAAGEVWLDSLGWDTASAAPTAWLGGRAMRTAPRAHAQHKGSRGDLLVVGGQDIAVNGAGMGGAAALAARAGLRGGAGRVYLVLLGAPADRLARWDPAAPELMLRTPDRLTPEALASACVVCGCGGGDAVAEHLPAVLAHSRRLVLDADALNHIAADTSLRQALRERGRRRAPTVLTPHPLEAARLWERSTVEVQAARLDCAQALADELGGVVVLKGSGTVIAAPGRTPVINPSGNARLGTAGTGDVLAGLIGAAWAPLAAPAGPDDAGFEAACAAVFQHGWLADQWDDVVDGTLTASRLAERVTAPG